MFKRNLTLPKLVDIEDWRKIQHYFSDVLGVTLRTIDINGKLLARTGSCSELCTELLKECYDSGFCKNCIIKKSPLKEKIGIGKQINLKCSVGLDLFVVPIKAFRDKIVAYVIIGPLILNKRKDKSAYAEYAKKSGIKLEHLMDTLISINVFSYSKVYSIVKLLESTFSHMTQTGYHKKRLGEIAPKVREIDPLFMRYYEEKVFNSFLKTCMIALDADSGSVMTLDKNTDTLHIKVASKIDQNIIDHTNIKLGEGIAGLAAANAEPIILPKDEKKDGLASKMKRRHIKSAMIMPFNKLDDMEVYGVLNLNIIRKNREFSEKDIAFTKELTSLASIALTPLK